MESAVVWALISIAATLFTYWLGRIHNNSQTKELRANNQMLLEYNEKLSKICERVSVLTGNQDARDAIEGWEQHKERLAASRKALKQMQAAEEQSRHRVRSNGFYSEHLRHMHMEEKLNQGARAFMPKETK